jgi:hypothetical protein
VSLFNASRTVCALLASAALAATATGCSPAGSNGAASAQAPAGGALQPASVAGTGMTVFTDPTENAFTVSVPQGWTVKGGIARSGGTAKPWITAASPDGATTISFGDPSIPQFTLPSGQNGPGGTVQTPGGPSPVEPFENSVQFAGDYAQRAYGSACSGMTPAGSQAEPALAQTEQAQGAQLTAAVGAPPPPLNDYDGGSATFTCQASGVADAVGVIDVTFLYQTPMGGFWNVPLIVAYRTPAASQAQTDQIARSIRQSFQTNAQWQAQMAEAGRQQYASSQQQGAAAQAALTQQEGAEGQALHNQAIAENSQLNAAHAATMNWLGAQGQGIQQNFANQQAGKQSGQDAEMRYINNQVCIRWYDAAHTQCAVTAQQ